MILRLSYEEVVALNSAAEQILGPRGEGSVVAPPEAIAGLEERLPIRGDISVRTLAEQRRLLRSLDLVLDHLSRRIDGYILDQYVGSEDSVAAFFDYANVLTARAKLAEIGEEMAALTEVITDGTPAEGDDIGFPD
jgi:hypothetical protein